MIVNGNVLGAGTVSVLRQCVGPLVICAKKNRELLLVELQVIDGLSISEAQALNLNLGLRVAWELL